MTGLFIKDVDPLILSWDMKPLPQGVFPALVVNLLHCKDHLRFQLKCLLRIVPCYHNVTTLHINYGDVLLVDIGLIGLQYIIQILTKVLYYT